MDPLDIEDQPNEPASGGTVNDVSLEGRWAAWREARNLRGLVITAGMVGETAPL